MSSKRPKIGMVTCDYTPSVGGMGKHVESLVSGLRSLFDVSVFSSHDRPGHFHIGKNILFSVGIERALSLWAQRENIDLLHVHTGPGGVLLRRRPSGIPLVVTANHTYAAQSRLPGQGWKKMLVGWERATYLAATHIVCISEDTAESVIGEYGIPASRVSVIHCGFDLAPWITVDRETTDRDRHSAVFVGRRDGRKGFDLLKDAWSIVLEKHPDAVLHVVGFTGTQERGIQYHGRVSDVELQNLVGRSRMLIMPSRLEGFGLVAAESIVAGTPCIASDVAGLRRIVRHDHDGLLITPDSSSFADAILRLFTDDILWSRLQGGTRSERNRFALEKERDAHATLYTSLYSSPG